jgi:long-chain-fatty-acid--CoA ligase ACSBG
MNNTGKIEEASNIGTTILMSSQGYADLVGTKNGQNLYWTTDVNAELPIKMAATGMGATIKPETIPAVFKRSALRGGDANAIKVMRDNKELTWSWKQYYNESFAFAKALHLLGIDERKAVNIMGFNSPEWAIAYCGSMMHNNVVSGVYATNGMEACLYQAEHSEAQVIVVETLA